MPSFPSGSMKRRLTLPRGLLFGGLMFCSSAFGRKDWHWSSPDQGCDLFRIANGQFIAIASKTFRGYGMSILTSADGREWTMRNPGDNVGLHCLAAGGGLILVGSEQGGIMASPFEAGGIAVRPPRIPAVKPGGRTLPGQFERGGRGFNAAGRRQPGN